MQKKNIQNAAAAIIWDNVSPSYKGINYIMRNAADDDALRQIKLLHCSTQIDLGFV